MNENFDEITPSRHFIKELKKGGLPLCTELTIDKASDVVLGGIFKVHWADSKKHTQQAGGLWLFDGLGERGHNLRY